MSRLGAPATPTAGPVTDGELIERAGTGDRPALEVLYGRYARAVFGLALRRLGDRGRAEDAVQETFVSIWRAAQTYRPGARARARRGSSRSRGTRSSTGAAHGPRPPIDVPDERVAESGRTTAPSRRGRGGASTARSRSCPSASAR